ncbi:MAG: hypothetical protein K6T83_14610, partial [Alicyclobacillus sp.]|nr:hypothetical protein [Alicyclobacillus sp.]
SVRTRTGLYYTSLFETSFNLSLMVLVLQPTYNGHKLTVFVVRKLTDSLAMADERGNSPELPRCHCSLYMDLGVVGCRFS